MPNIKLTIVTAEKKYNFLITNVPNQDVELTVDLENTEEEKVYTPTDVISLLQNISDNLQHAENLLESNLEEKTPALLTDALNIQTREETTPTLLTDTLNIPDREETPMDVVRLENSVSITVYDGLGTLPIIARNAGDPNRGSLTNIFQDKLIFMNTRIPPTAEVKQNREFATYLMQVIDMLILLLMNSSDPDKVERGRYIDRLFLRYLLKMPAVATIGDFCLIINTLKAPIDSETSDITEIRQKVIEIFHAIRRGAMRNIVDAMKQPGCNCTACA